MKLSLAPSGTSVVLVLLLAASGCSEPTAAQTPSPVASASEPPADSTLDRVSAGHPEHKTLQLYTTQPGRIQAFEETPLHPKIAAYVEQVLVDIGDRVAKDQLLVKLAVPELQDEVEQKVALVAQSKAEVEQAVAGVDAAVAAVATAQARVSESQAAVGRTEADFQYWKDQHARIKDLAESGSVTQKLVDENLNQFRAAQSTRDEARANVQSTHAALKEAEANVQRAKADRIAAAARLRVAEANLARSKTMLAYTEIKSPFDGVVTRRTVDTGHYVHPPAGGNMPLVVVARVDQVRVFVDVPEMEAPLVDGGDQADQALVTVQSLENRQFAAGVRRTSWSLDAANRSLRVEVDLPNEDGTLRPGMYARVSILLAQRDDVLCVPATAVLRESRDAYCYVVDNGTVRRQPVELGLRSGNDVEIVSGLSADQLIVLTRVDSLSDGQPVAVITPGS